MHVVLGILRGNTLQALADASTSSLEFTRAELQKRGVPAGAASTIAGLLVSVGDWVGGNASVQVAVYVATVLVSSVVANNAAAALMYPVAINVAKQRGIRTDLMAVLLMLAASASFAVPFGYQTNLMVYGAGGYTFSDFFRFGGLLQVWLTCISPFGPIEWLDIGRTFPVSAV